MAQTAGLVVAIQETHLPLTLLLAQRHLETLQALRHHRVLMAEEVFLTIVNILLAVLVAGHLPLVATLRKG
jgi:hypothetical protein